MCWSELEKVHLVRSSLILLDSLNTPLKLNIRIYMQGHRPVKRKVSSWDGFLNYVLT